MYINRILVKLDKIAYRSATEVGFQPVEKWNIRDVAAEFCRIPAGTGIRSRVPHLDKPEQKPECAT